MPLYEYKVVPAPNRGEKARGLKTQPERFANALSILMNDLGRDGWEYLRADTLPSEERSGLTKRSTVYHAVLVFRRALPEKPATEPEAARPRLLVTDAPAGKAPPLVPDQKITPPKSAPAPSQAENDTLPASGGAES